MNIKVIAITKGQKMSAKGTPYEQLEVTYKNLTYNNKTETKLLLPFGAQKSAFEALSNAIAGDEFTVQVQKNAKGYNDWVSATPGATAPAPAQAFASGGVGGQATASPRSNYETPEERAKRQIYIVRQSSVSNAIELLTTGAKAPPAVEDVLKVAKEFENFVFGTDTTGNAKEAAVGADGLANMDDDIPY